MQQLSLILPAPTARRRDPSTSKDAARKAATFADSHRERILAALASPGTVKDIEARTGIQAHAAGKRMIELQRMNLAEPTEERRDGCRVWTRCS